MLNGSKTIDKAELADRLRMAREDRGMGQVAVAKLVGSPQTWISQLELRKANLREEHVERLEKLSEVLGFEIPYVGEHHEEVATIKAQPVEAAKPPMTLPRRIEPAAVNLAIPAQRAGDAELEAIKACCDAMEKLRDKDACQRVLGYVRARYGLPRLPEPRP